MTIPPHCTYIVIERGKHRGEIGWMRGTWNDKLKQVAGWNVHPSAAKVYVNGVKPHAFAMRFDFVREATPLEIGLYEQEQERRT